MDSRQRSTAITDCAAEIDGWFFPARFFCSSLPRIIMKILLTKGGKKIKITEQVESKRRNRWMVIPSPLAQNSPPPSRGAKLSSATMEQEDWIKMSGFHEEAGKRARNIRPDSIIGNDTCGDRPLIWSCGVASCNDYFSLLVQFYLFGIMIFLIFLVLF